MANPATTTRHYADSSDNPCWVTTTKNNTTTTTRFTTSIGGDLGVETTTNQPNQLSIPDLHGDIVATITIPATGNATTNDIQPLTVDDEYGNPANPTPNTGNLTYGWVGSKQRAQDLTGLILMGARPYNPKTGLFTSTDPVEGGNTTTYAYPQDPINHFDLTGQFSLKGAFKSIGKFVKNNWVDIALTAASFVPVAGAVAIGVKAVQTIKVARVIRAANKVVKVADRTKKVASGSIRASVKTTERAAAKWVVPNPGVGEANNWARMLVERGAGPKTQHVYRAASKKATGYGSNLTRGRDKGYNTYANLHIIHPRYPR